MFAPALLPALAPALLPALAPALLPALAPALPTAVAPALPSTLVPAKSPAPLPASALVHAGQILSTQLPVHPDLVAGSPDETLQVVAAQYHLLQAPALLCSRFTTTRDARAARTPNPEPSR
jgi:hypothetical protein